MLNILCLPKKFKRWMKSLKEINEVKTKLRELRKITTKNLKRFPEKNRQKQKIWKRENSTAISDHHSLCDSLFDPGNKWLKPGNQFRGNYRSLGPTE